MITLHVEAVPPSNNVSQGKGGRGRALAYQNTKKMWVDMLWVLRSKLKARGELDRYTLPLPAATIIMVYHFKTRARRDPDNYSGKMILDALKVNGFIQDDSFKEIDIFPLATFGKTDRDYTEIFIIQGQRIRNFVTDLVSSKGGDTE